nr:uncharacterized protein LOC105865120 [Microcebus murinus]
MASPGGSSVNGRSQAAKGFCAVRVPCLIDSAPKLMFTRLYSSCSDGCDMPPGCGEADSECEGDQTDDNVSVLQSPGEIFKIFILFSSRALINWNGSWLQTTRGPSEGAEPLPCRGASARGHEREAVSRAGGLRTQLMKNRRVLSLLHLLLFTRGRIPNLDCFRGQLIFPQWGFSQSSFLLKDLFITKWRQRKSTFFKHIWAPSTIAYKIKGKKPSVLKPFWKKANLHLIPEEEATFHFTA